MAPSRPFGRGGFTTLDRRKATAQSLLARAWRSCVARRCFALRLDEAHQEQQRRRLLEQKRAVAERLATERRATTVTRKKQPQSGLHLQQLFRVLPDSGAWDGDAPGTTLSSPIRSEDSFSTRWLVGEGLASGPPSRLSTFQVEELGRVRAEYQHARAATPSHLAPTWTQAMRTKSSRSFMSSEWQGSYQRDERMLLGHTGVGASGLGSTPDSRSCAPLWIEPTVYQAAFPPPDLETMQQACAPESRTLLTHLLQRGGWVAAAELLAGDCDAPGSTRLSSSALAAFSLSACRECIVHRQYTHALMLLRLANTAIAEEASAGGELHLVQRPVLRAFDKKPLMEIERSQPFLLTPTPSPIPAASAQPAAGETMVFLRSPHVPLNSDADTPSDIAEAAERPSLAAFHADMMALYLHRKGKDNEALKWCTRALKLEAPQNVSACTILCSHCAVVLARLKRFHEAFNMLTSACKAQATYMSSEACLEAGRDQQLAHTVTLVSALLTGALLHMRHLNAAAAVQDALCASKCCSQALDAHLSQNPAVFANIMYRSSEESEASSDASSVMDENEQVLTDEHREQRLDQQRRPHECQDSFVHQQDSEHSHQSILRRLDMKVGRVLRDARALLSSQLSVKKARLVTWSAAPLSEQIRTGEHLLEESPVFSGSADPHGTLARVALRRRPVSVTVASRKFEVERGDGGNDAGAGGEEQPGDFSRQRAMSATPARTSQVALAGQGRDLIGKASRLRPRARSAMSRIARGEVDEDQFPSTASAELEDGDATTIDIKDTVWGSLSSGNGFGAGRAKPPGTLFVPQNEGELTRPTTSQSDRKSSPDVQSSSSPDKSLMEMMTWDDSDQKAHDRYQRDVSPLQGQLRGEPPARTTGSERRGSSVTFDVTHIFGRRKLSGYPRRPASSHFIQPSLPRRSPLAPGSNPDQGSKCASATRQMQMQERVVRGVVSPYFLDPRRKFGLHLQ